MGVRKEWQRLGRENFEINKHEKGTVMRDRMMVDREWRNETGLERWRGVWGGRRGAKSGLQGQVAERCRGEGTGRMRRDVSLVTGTLGMAQGLAEGRPTGFEWLTKVELDEARRIEREEEKRRHPVESELERRRKIIAIIDEHMMGPPPTWKFR